MQWARRQQLISPEPAEFCLTVSDAVNWVDAVIKENYLPSLTELLMVPRLKRKELIKNSKDLLLL